MTDDWESDAKCASPAITVDMTSDDPAEIQRAKAVCRQCPVRLACAQAALDRVEMHGVWGGTEDWQRRRALGLDSDGNPKINAADIWCPFCQSRDVSITKKRAYKGYPVHCGRCGLGWHTYRYPLKVRRAMKRRQERKLADMGTGVG